VSVTESQAKALIVATVGDVDPATGTPPSPASVGIVATSIDVLWDSYAAMEAVYPGLQRLMTERHAYRLVLGVVRRQYDLKAGTASLARSQQAKAIEDAMAALDEQILAVQRSYGAGTAASGTIARTAPVMPCDAAAQPGLLDANDPRLTGSPYRASRWGR
jgi:hypothetical protein